ncbi:hypothetical protein SBOR_6648 [Sclerotinia borealis F-4128]|uniref:RNase H type-1 domain-containing protein n=1 Tax=Sclerotinia borealis (strain F-4128) TaxID=1432307 RepID=W9C8A7_SCLBF|nr:hypothetical protein SBOR_6648 [Sclerotinia borealis F-4128]
MVSRAHETEPIGGFARNTLRSSAGMADLSNSEYTTGRWPAIWDSRTRGTKLKALEPLVSFASRPILTPLHFSPGCYTNPTKGVKKETAAEEFKEWWSLLLEDHTTVFSDGSEQYDQGKFIGYGYAIYKGQALVGSGYGAINIISYVFDAEAIGALKGLQYIVRLTTDKQTLITICIDSTSVIWCICTNAVALLQWAFLECYGIIETRDINIRWSSGYIGIEGNEQADRLADLGAKSGRVSEDNCAHPTISDIGSIACLSKRNTTYNWWCIAKNSLSATYSKWELEYSIKEPPELTLPRGIFHRLLAMCIGHGDFSFYHCRFQYTDAELNCIYGYNKTPDHIFFCDYSVRKFRKWPNRAPFPPANKQQGMDYIKSLFGKPKDFADFLKQTRCFEHPYQAV